MYIVKWHLALCILFWYVSSVGYRIRQYCAFNSEDAHMEYRNSGWLEDFLFVLWGMWMLTDQCYKTFKHLTLILLILPGGAGTLANRIKWGEGRLTKNAHPFSESNYNTVSNSVSNYNGRQQQTSWSIWLALQVNWLTTVLKQHAKTKWITGFIQ